MGGERSEEVQRTGGKAKWSNKKDHLIYSSPSLGTATESNAGAVSASAKNVGAESRGGISASDKSGDLIISTIAPEKVESKENTPHEKK